MPPAANIAEGHTLAAAHAHLHRTRPASVAAAERVVLEAVRRPCDFAAVRDLRTVAAVDIVAREGQGSHATAADRDLHYLAEDHSRRLDSRASDSDLRNHAADHLHGLHIHSAALRNLHTHFDIPHRHALVAARRTRDLHRRTRDLHRRTRRTFRYTDVRTHGREIHVKSLTHDVHAYYDAFRACSIRDDVPLSVDRGVAYRKVTLCHETLFPLLLLCTPGTTRNSEMPSEDSISGLFSLAF